jgi:FSR family fosmidomycin resistance protein-like MFS transporter
VTAPLAARAPRGVDRRGIATLSVGHLAADFAQGVVPALLVFLIPKHDLSYTGAAAVILMSSLSAALVQPLSGHLSDRRGGMWQLSAGVLLGGAGVAGAAVAPSYPLLLLSVFVAGLGVGAFHPEAAKFALYVSGERRASGMSLFSIGGNAGIAVGPILTSTIVLALGLTGGLLLVIPGVVAAALLLAGARHLSAFLPERAERREHEARPRTVGAQTGALWLLVLISVLRSVGYFGIITFVPLYEVSQGAGEAEATRLLTYILAAGAAATLLAGPLADRIGLKPVIVWSGVATVPLLLFYDLHGGWLGAAAVMLCGAGITGTFGVQIVLAQQYMPRHVAMASGLTVGVPIGAGAAAAVLLGAIADAVDLRTALLATAVAPAAAVFLTFALPPVRGQRETAVYGRALDPARVDLPG